MPEITEENYQGNLLLSKFNSIVNTLGTSELLGVPWQRRVAMAEVSSIWGVKPTYMAGPGWTLLCLRWPRKLWVNKGISSATHIVCPMATKSWGKKTIVSLCSQSVLLWVESQSVRGEANHWGTTRLTQQREEEKGQSGLTFDSLSSCI